MNKFILYDNITRKQFFRWHELMALVNKVDGRRSLVFEDQGYVSDTESFLTGCVSNFPLFFMFDSSTINWIVLHDVKKFKTLLDFYNNKITCQGYYYKDIEGYKRDRLANLSIESFCMNPCSREEREQTIKFLMQ